MRILSKYNIDIQFIKFVIVGVTNTIFGTAIMLGMYNIFGCNYYLSSICNYFFGSILSYFLNKYFTFNYTKKDLKVVLKFILNITICYIISYGLAKPLVGMILLSFDKKIVDNIAMLVGMVLFVFCNYFGQKLLVFNKDGEVNEEI